MFTGLIEAVATVRELSAAGAAEELRITLDIPAAVIGDTTDAGSATGVSNATGAGSAGASGCRIGDSVAINGCCLTVVEIGPTGRESHPSAWSFQAGAETLSKTNLGELAVGSRVNIERAMRADGRFGGHVVQGHVDGQGRVAEIRPHGDWTDMVFSLPPELALQLVPKGSITIDGVSLTVVNCDADRCSVALIPHTLAETTLGRRKVGDAVNIETDILGKYVQKYLAHYAAARTDRGPFE